MKINNTYKVVMALSISCMLGAMEGERPSKQPRLEEEPVSSQQSPREIPSLINLSLKALTDPDVAGQLHILLNNFNVGEDTFSSILEFSFLKADNEVPQTLVPFILSHPKEFSLFFKELINSYLGLESSFSLRKALAIKTKGILESTLDFDNALNAILGDELFAARATLEEALVPLVQHILRTPFDDDLNTILHWAAERAFLDDKGKNAQVFAQLIGWYPHLFLTNKNKNCVIDLLMNSIPPLENQQTLKTDQYPPTFNAGVEIQSSHPFFKDEFRLFRNLLGIAPTSLMKFDQNLNWLLLSDNYQKVKEAVEGIKSDNLRLRLIPNSQFWNSAKGRWENLDNNILNYCPLIVSFGSCSADLLLQSQVPTQVHWPEIAPEIGVQPFFSCIDFFLRCMGQSGPGVRVAIKRFIESPLFEELDADKLFEYIGVNERVDFTREDRSLERFDDTIALTYAYYYSTIRKKHIAGLFEDLAHKNLLKNCLSASQEVMPLWMLAEFIREQGFTEKDLKDLGCGECGSGSFPELQQARNIYQNQQELGQLFKRFPSLPPQPKDESMSFFPNEWFYPND